VKRGSFFGAAIGAPWIFGVWLVTGNLARCHAVVLMAKLQSMLRLRIAKTVPSFVRLDAEESWHWTLWECTCVIFDHREIG
jgi:hypothetical protein